MLQIIDTYSARSSRAAFDRNKIDWQELEAYGLTRETLRQSKAFEAMLRGERSSNMHQIVIKDSDGDDFLLGYARLNFERKPNGKVGVEMHFPIHESEAFASPFYARNLTDDEKAAYDRRVEGYRFSYTEQTTLRQIRNLGRIVNLADPYTGYVTPSFVSMDRQTNELISMEVAKLRIPANLPLDKEQKQDLQSGKGLWVEGLQSPSRKTFSAMLQVSAEKKGVEFIFENDPRLQKIFNTTLQIPSEICGVRLTTVEQTRLEGGFTLSFSKMKQGDETFAGQVRMNFKTGKPEIIRTAVESRPQIKKEAKIEATPKPKANLKPQIHKAKSKNLKL